MLRYFIMVSASLLLSVPAVAQELKGEFKDWAVFSATESGGKVCYITSNPTKKTGTYKIRGDVYMLVTYRNHGVPQVSIDTGFPYKKGSEVDFTINGTKTFKFFTSPKTPQMAWAKDEQMDRTVIESMKHSARAVTKGTSEIGTYAQDTYSLKGFTAAYNKMMALCQ